MSDQGRWPEGLTINPLATGGAKFYPAQGVNKMESTSHHSAPLSGDHVHAVEAPAAVDPVCGMTVDMTTGKPTHTHNGLEFHFCSQKCHDKFVLDPEHYVSGAHKEPDSPGKHRPSDGSERDAVPLAAEWRYDLPEFGGYLGNVGWKSFKTRQIICHMDRSYLVLATFPGLAAWRNAENSL